MSPEELRRLLRVCAAAADGAAHPGASRMRRQHWDHWAASRRGSSSSGSSSSASSSDDDAALRRLRLALHGSVAIAAAFTRDARVVAEVDRCYAELEDSFEEEDEGEGGASGSSMSTSGDDDEFVARGGSASSAGSSSSSSSSASGVALPGSLLGWGGAAALLLRRPPRRPPARLVGFARAAGDYSLAATLHDVAVHPALRGAGVGQRLVQRVVTQVRERRRVGVLMPTCGAVCRCERVWPVLGSPLTPLLTPSLLPQRHPKT